MSVPSTLKCSLFIEEIKRDPFYASIIESNAFQRLAHISFLGAIDYARNWKLHKSLRTRFSHSLGVAALAKFVSDSRGYDQDTERHLVCAALLHDVGHFPLSHSAEVVLKKRLGFNHHELANHIIDGHFNLGRSLRFRLSRRVDPDRVKSLISGQCDEQGADLFGSKVNIDTIDGITRTAHYEQPEIDATLTLRVAEAAFLEKGEDRYKSLDNFWLLKNQMYSSFIHSRLGLQSDFISQKFFEQQELKGNDLIADERRWQDRFINLFNMFCANSSQYSYSSREYLINKEHCSEDRFILKKATHTIYLDLPWVVLKT